MSYLILGCQDFSDESGFFYCSHLSNIILKEEDISQENKDKVISFLLDSCELSKRPCYDYNKVANIIKYLYNKYRVIDEKLLTKIQMFFKLYKNFGIYLRIEWGLYGKKNK